MKAMDNIVEFQKGCPCEPIEQKEIEVIFPTILFCVDNASFDKESQYIAYISEVEYSSYAFCDNYTDTKEAIQEKKDYIITTSIANLCHDVMEKYNVYLCYKDKKVKVQYGMELKDYYLDWDDNIVEAFIAGQFDGLLK